MRLVAAFLVGALCVSGLQSTQTEKSREILKGQTHATPSNASTTEEVSSILTSDGVEPLSSVQASAVTTSEAPVLELESAEKSKKATKSTKKHKEKSKKAKKHKKKRKRKTTRTQSKLPHMLSSAAVVEKAANKKSIAKGASTRAVVKNAAKAAAEKNCQHCFKAGKKCCGVKSNYQCWEKSSSECSHLQQNAQSASVANTKSTAALLENSEKTVEKDEKTSGSDETVMLAAGTPVVPSSTNFITTASDPGRPSSWPTWLVVTFWVVGIPFLATLGLLAFAGLAVLCNSHWQSTKQEPEALSIGAVGNGGVFGAKPAQSRMLPEGWAVHLNDEGNIYYVNTQTGESMWEFPGDEATAKTKVSHACQAQPKEIGDGVKDDYSTYSEDTTGAGAIM